MVVDMEKNIYLQNQLIDQWNAEVKALGKEKEIFPPHKPQKILPPKKSDLSVALQKPEKKAPGYAAKAFIIVMIISLIPIFDGGIRFLSFTIISSLFWASLIAIIVYLLNRDKDKTVAKSYQARYKKYQEECKEIENFNQISQQSYHTELDHYNHSVAEDRERVIGEEIKKSALKVEITRLQAQKEKSQRVLEQIYSKNIIFPKYRNLVMVCSLYEYICAGRCTTLEGHEGAYNILEMEIRLDRIITQLDKVVKKLNSIQNNQFMLYTAIQETNRQLSAIRNEIGQMVTHFEEAQALNYRMAENTQAYLEKIRENNATLQAQFASLQQSSALTAYQAERTQKELHYMNRMNYLSGKYDDVFFNLPPT